MTGMKTWMLGAAMVAGAAALGATQAQAAEFGFLQMRPLICSPKASAPPSRSTPTFRNTTPTLFNEFKHLFIR